MKRFLNKCRTVNIVPFIDLNNKEYSKKFKLSSSQPSDIQQTSLTNRELVLGYDSVNESTYLFLHDNGELFSLSHDDFSYDFLRLENEKLEEEFDKIETSIPVASSTIIVEDTPE